MSLRVLKLLRISIDSVVFRFHSNKSPLCLLIESILFRILSDRVFFESSKIGFSSSGFTVIDFSLYQYFFSAMLLFFYQIVFYFFYQKQMFCFASITSLTCFNNLTDSQKVKKCIIKTQSIILKICATNFPIYI